MITILTGLLCLAATIAAAHAVATLDDRDPLAAWGDDPHDWSNRR